MAAKKDFADDMEDGKATTTRKEQSDHQAEKLPDLAGQTAQNSLVNNDSEQLSPADHSMEPPSELARVDTGPPYSIFKPWQKKLIVFSASLGAVFSPMSTTIYLPALNSIASDLKVSNADINLTVTTFLVGHAVPKCLPAIADICKDYAGSCAYTCRRLL